VAPTISSGTASFACSHTSGLEEVSPSRTVGTLLVLCFFYSTVVLFCLCIAFLYFMFGVFEVLLSVSQSSYTPSTFFYSLGVSSHFLSTYRLTPFANRLNTPPPRHLNKEVHPPPPTIPRPGTRCFPLEPYLRDLPQFLLLGDTPNFITEASRRTGFALLCVSSVRPPAPAPHVPAPPSVNCAFSLVAGLALCLLAVLPHLNLLSLKAIP